MLVVTGPPGAGKSAVAERIVERFERSALVEGDRFFAFLRSGQVEPWLPGSDRQNTVVTEAAAAATGQFVRGGFDTVYDGVVGPWFLDAFVSKSGVPELDYVILLPPVEVCVSRVADRSGHGFSDEAATRHMHAQFATGVVASRHVVSDPIDGVDAVADAVLARRSDGMLRHATS